MELLTSQADFLVLHNTEILQNKATKAISTESLEVRLDQTMIGAAIRRLIWIITNCKYQDRMFLLHPPDLWYHLIA